MPLNINARLKRCLIIEDDENLRRSLAGSLSEWAEEVKECELIT